MTIHDIHLWKRHMGPEIPHTLDPSLLSFLVVPLVRELRSTRSCDFLNRGGGFIKGILRGVRCTKSLKVYKIENCFGSDFDFCVISLLVFGTDSDQNRTLEEIPRSGADTLPLIKPLRRMRTLCGHTQTQVWSESSVDEHNLYFARPAIVG